MRKLFLLVSLFSLFAFAVSAQYHYIPYINAGENPKGVNLDYDDDAFYLSDWNFIFQDTLTDSWSPVQSLPFAFKFNGSPVTQFKVSTSAVVTFTTGVGAAPASSNLALPSASVPDKSICIMGLDCKGGNDIVSTKTFGVAPNRQFWIDFASFSYFSAVGYNYWSVVLEETSNNIYFVDKGSYAPVNLSIGVQINSSEAYTVSGSPNVTAKATDIQYSDDNTYYMFIPGVQPSNEIELTSINLNRFVVIPGNVNITGKITNYGSTPITSFIVKYQDGNNPVQSFTKTGVNVALGKAYSFTHGTPLSMTNASTYSLKVWAELAGDVDHTNDTLRGISNGVSFAAVRNMVFEEGTGTWCGWCPRGAVYMDSLNNTHPDRANLIAVHNSDPMTVSAYDGPLSNMLSGYPSGVADRKYIDDPSSFISIYNQHINDVMPCEVSAVASFNSTSRVMTINATARFGTAFDGDFRFNAVVTEDSLKGSGSTWSQKNYYSYSSQNLPLTGAGHNWQAEANPVPAAKMTYNHVARTILGGFDGVAGSIPSTVTNNGVYNKSFTYTVPAGYNVNNLKVIVWVYNSVTGEIYNSAKVNSVVGIDEQNQLANKLMVYPNPSSGIIMIQSAVEGNAIMKLNVLNSLGQVIMSYDKLNLNENGVYLNLSSYDNGLYFLQFTDEKNNTAVSKVVLDR